MRVRSAIARLKTEDGAHIVEFALVAPVLFFLFFAVMYGVLAVTANVTLAHATSAGMRYATIPLDNIAPIYPSPDQVAARVFDSTPFFAQDNCVTSVAGAPAPNAVVSLNVSCPFANPLGPALDGLRVLFGAGDAEPLGDSFQMSASATGRRE